MQIADTHCHYYFQQFDGDCAAVVAADTASGVQLQVQIGCDKQSSMAAIRLAKQHHHMRATIGVHPTAVAPLFNIEHRQLTNNRISFPADTHQSLDEMMTWMADTVAMEPNLVVGIGETGLDRYHDDSQHLLEWQTDSFIRHVALARDTDLALVVHTRNARVETLDFLGAHIRGKNIRGVIHSFADDTEFAQFCWQECDMFLGIGGIASYASSQATRDAIAATPIEYLVCETDAPFLVPRGFRKQGCKRAESKHIIEIIELIAQLHRQSVAYVADAMWQNSQRLFNT